MYHRTEKGVIVKENDHLMDCTRYLVLSGMKRAITKPSGLEPRFQSYGVLDSVVGM